MKDSFTLNGEQVKVSFEYAKQELKNFLGVRKVKGVVNAHVTIGSNRVTGVALCSVKDTFNKEKGRKIAVSRAISHLPRNVRRQFWDNFLGW